MQGAIWIRTFLLLPHIVVELESLLVLRVLVQLDEGELFLQRARSLLFHHGTLILRQPIVVLIVLVSALANCPIMTRRSLLLRMVALIQCI